MWSVNLQQNKFEKLVHLVGFTIEVYFTSCPTHFTPEKDPQYLYHTGLSGLQKWSGSNGKEKNLYS